MHSVLFANCDGPHVGGVANPIPLLRPQWTMHARVASEIPPDPTSLRTCSASFLAFLSLRNVRKNFRTSLMGFRPLAILIISSSDGISWADHTLCALAAYHLQQRPGVTRSV